MLFHNINITSHIHGIFLYIHPEIPPHVQPTHPNKHHGHPQNNIIAARYCMLTTSLTIDTIEALHECASVCMYILTFVEPL